MSKHTLLSLVIEVFWLVLIILFAFAVNIPIYKVLHFQSVKFNFLQVLVFGLAFRYVLYFNKIAYLKPLLGRILFALVVIPIAVIIYQHLKEMTLMLDTFGIDAFIQKDLTLKHAEVRQAFTLFRNEFILFSVGSLILLFLLELRLILSFLSDLRKIK